jgi:hypothetical protein
VVALTMPMTVCSSVLWKENRQAAARWVTAAWVGIMTTRVLRPTSGRDATTVSILGRRPPLNTASRSRNPVGSTCRSKAAGLEVARSKRSQQQVEVVDDQRRRTGACRARGVEPRFSHAAFELLKDRLVEHEGGGLLGRGDGGVADLVHYRLKRAASAPADVKLADPTHALPHDQGRADRTTGRFGRRRPWLVVGSVGTVRL